MAQAISVIGTPVPRVEGPDKVTGRATYAADVLLPGTLWGKILRSPYPHARIVRIDASGAWEVPGVKAVITGKDIPGRLWGKRIRDMPVLCWDKVRFVGDRVAAVAADTAEAAEEALQRIEVEYEELPGVFDPLAAMEPEAPRLHDDVTAYEGGPQEYLIPDVPNGLTRLTWNKGDVEQGFREADLIFDHTFRIPSRHQGYIEPHAGTVTIDEDGRIQVWTSSKTPFATRAQLAKAIGLPEERVRMNPVNVGGEFGGKGGAMDLPAAYFLAQQAGQPVKIVMSYTEELMAGSPSHPTVITIRTGVKRDGHMVARHLRAVHASGAYGAQKPNASLSTWHYVGGPYRVDHASFEFTQVYTNTVPGGYFRGPGALQTYFALECHTDLIAQGLGMDPAAFRLQNLIDEGEEDAIGQRLRGLKARQTLQAALDAAGWGRPKPGPNYGRGIALFGRHIGGDRTGVVLSVDANGTFTLLSPTIDQGVGIHTILRQMVAEEMRVSLQQVQVVIGDTDIAPYDDGARASRGTYTAGHAVLKACADLRTQLAAQAAGMLECPQGDIDYGGSRFWARQDPGHHASLGEVVVKAGGPLRVTAEVELPTLEDVTYMCAQVAEVEVDRETGQVRLHRLVTAHDVGTIINPIGHQGQIDGGAVMGIGQALMEELTVADGQITSLHLGDYKLPTVADIPKLETVLVRSGGGTGPYEAKAIGELSNNSPPAAIANAVADAVGARLFDLPITAERVYRALKEKGREVTASRL